MLQALYIGSPTGHSNHCNFLGIITEELSLQMTRHSSILLIVRYFFYTSEVVGWFLNVLVNYLVISRTGSKTERLTMLRAATHETELGDHDLCLSRSHYTDTDPTSRERAATAGIEPGTSSSGVARSTDWATAPPTSEVRKSLSQGLRVDLVQPRLEPETSWFQSQVSITRLQQHTFWSTKS